MEERSNFVVKEIEDQQLATKLVKAHPKYFFPLIGFSIGSLVSLIIIGIEEFTAGHDILIEGTHLENIAIPILFGIVGTLIGFIRMKQNRKRKSTINDLLSSHQSLNKVLDNLPELISYLDNQLNYRYANKAHEKWKGLSTTNIYGNNIKDVLTPESAYLIIQHIEENRGSKIIRFETSGENDGQEYFLLYTIIPDLDNNRIAKGYFFIITPITELRKRENLIKRQKDELAELNATKDKFFSIIAHDLKSPFNALLGFSEMLHKEYHSLHESQRREFIGMIYESSQNTYKLLENLLVWVLSQSGTIEYHPKVINIKSRIDENLNLLQPVAARKNIHLRSIISENIEISTDPDLIDIVIRNLVTNAIKFSLENQEVSVSVIRIPGNEGNDSVEIAVSDKGIGISPGNMKKLFQMDNNYSTQGTGGESGTGLGLLLCKEFVEKCGGTIWVESEPGKGSTFHFSIPNNKTPDGNIHV